MLVAVFGFRVRRRYHGDSGHMGRKSRRITGKTNWRAKGILYAHDVSNVPVPLRTKFAINWPIPMKSCTAEVVRPRSSTGQISAA